jgi:hypothetical protein
MVAIPKIIQKTARRLLLMLDLCFRSWMRVSSDVRNL